MTTSDHDDQRPDQARAAAAARARQTRPSDPSEPVAPDETEDTDAPSATADGPADAAAPDAAPSPVEADQADTEEPADEPAVEDDAVAEPAAPADGPSRARRWPVVALAVACVALAAGLVVSLLALHSQDQISSARTSALAAGRTYAVELSSYKYTELNHDFALVLHDSTPTFQTNYTKSSQALNKILVQYKASATGTVLAAGIVSANADRAVVLVDVNQSVTNSTSKKPTNDESRLQMTLVHQGGRWLIDKLQLL